MTNVVVALVSGVCLGGFISCIAPTLKGARYLSAVVLLTAGINLIAGLYRG